MEGTLHNIRHREVGKGFDLGERNIQRNHQPHLGEFRDTFAGQKFPPLSDQIRFLFNCFDSELHREVAWQGVIHPLAQTLGRLTLCPDTVEVTTNHNNVVLTVP